MLAICGAARNASRSPTIYQGTGGEHSAYPWTIMMPTDTAIAENLRATVRRLADMRVGTTVILSGHFADEQRAMLRGLAQEWAQDAASPMRLIATTLADREVSPVAPDHAGIRAADRSCRPRSTAKAPTHDLATASRTNLSGRCAHPA